MAPEHIKRSTRRLVKSYQQLQDELTASVDGDTILRGHRLIIPAALQTKAVDLAHEGHQGIVKTKALLREKIWFPGIDKMVERRVKSCIPCQASVPETKREPLKMSPLPTAPWTEISVDFAELRWIPLPCRFNSKALS